MERNLSYLENLGSQPLTEPIAPIGVIGAWVYVTVVFGLRASHRIEAVVRSLITLLVETATLQRARSSECAYQ